MMMPSMVSRVRILWAVIANKDILKASLKRSRAGSRDGVSGFDVGGGDVVGCDVVGCDVDCVSTSVK